MGIKNWIGKALFTAGKRSFFYDFIWRSKIINNSKPEGTIAIIQYCIWIILSTVNWRIMNTERAEWNMKLMISATSLSPAYCLILFFLFCLQKSMGLRYAPHLWSPFMQHLRILTMRHVFATCASMATCWSHPSLWTWCCVSDSCNRLYFKPCSNCHSLGLWLCAVTWFQSMLDKGNIPKHLYPGLCLSCSTLLHSSLATGSSVLCAALLLYSLLWMLCARKMLHRVFWDMCSLHRR